MIAIVPSDLTSFAAIEVGCSRFCLPSCNLQFSNVDLSCYLQLGRKLCWNYSFVRTKSNTSVMLPTAERQPTAVSIRPYVIHSTVYIGDHRPTELIKKTSNAFYSTAHLHFQQIGIKSSNTSRNSRFLSIRFRLVALPDERRVHHFFSFSLSLLSLLSSYKRMWRSISPSQKLVEFE